MISRAFRCCLPSTPVVVAFEAGDFRRPYIVGSAWNGKESLPESPESANNKRLIKTRSGSLLEFDDTPGRIEDHYLYEQRAHSIA